MKKIRIGVMGCAHIAQRSVIPAILALDDRYELTAIASRTREKADACARRFGCEGLPSYEELLQRGEIDAVYMPLPTGLHREWIVKALEAGKHVYAEKSIAMNAADAAEMVRAARANDCALMEGYMFQYHTQHRKVFELLQAGTLGEIRHFKASFGFPPFPDKDNFRYDATLGGGALKDAAGYTVRAASFILDTPLEVAGAAVRYDPSGSSLFGSAFLRAEGGIGASVSFGFDNFYQCNYEIWGSKGKLTATRAFTPKPAESPVLVVETPQHCTEITCAPCDHFVGAFEEFSRLCRGEGREKHYDQILVQSRLLDQIENFSK